MNNQKRSPVQQFFMVLALTYLGMYAAQRFGLFGAPPTQNQTGGRVAKPALTLRQAFAGLTPASGALSKTQAQAEVKTLDAAVAQNGSDEYSYSARLRSALLQQYLIGDSKAALKSYEEIIHHAGTDVITAQATYQKGDLLWNQAQAAGDVKNGIVLNSSPAVQESAKTLEQLIHKGRGSSAFLDLQINVPRGQTNADALPDFQLMRVGDLRGTLANPNPAGIPDRVNAYYQTTTFYKVFDTVVHVFGANPAFSYGLAILFFAVFTRVLMQPLNKKQYESMKGLQVIAPEMKKIQEKYKGKPEQQMQMVKETRELQAAHGVSPMLGCGLAAVQLPIFFFVVYPLIQHYEAKLELAGASFLWIPNLARPDIPLLMAYALSQFLSFRLSATPPTDPQQAQIQATMGILMPLTVPFFLHSYPSAFTLYWMTFNVISTFFQYRLMKAADPQKSLIKTLVGKTPPLETAPDATESAIPPRPQTLRRKSSGAKSDSASIAALDETRDDTIPDDATRSESPRDGLSSTHAVPRRSSTRRETALNGARINARDAQEDGDAEVVTTLDTSSQNGAGNGAKRNGAARNGSGQSDATRTSRRSRQRRRH